MSERPPKAPKLAPPPKYFPKVVISGLILSNSCNPPPELREVITSSKIKQTPLSCVAFLIDFKNSMLAGIHPPLPSIGSTSTAAKSAAFSLISSTVRATSLYRVLIIL